MITQAWTLDNLCSTVSRKVPRKINGKVSRTKFNWAFATLSKCIVRQHSLINPVQAMFGEKIPEDSHFLTLCAEQDRSPASEFTQVLGPDGFLTHEFQYIGVDHNAAVAACNTMRLYGRGSKPANAATFIGKPLQRCWEDIGDRDIRVAFLDLMAQATNDDSVYDLARALTMIDTECLIAYNASMERNGAWSVDPAHIYEHLRLIMPVSELIRWQTPDVYFRYYSDGYSMGTFYFYQGRKSINRINRMARSWMRRYQTDNPDREQGWINIASKH